MTATADPIAEAAAKAWAMLSVRRAGLGLGLDEPSAPLAVAFDLVLDATGGERPTAFMALRRAAADALEASGKKMPGKLYGNPESWAADARAAVYLISLQGVSNAIHDLFRARAYWHEMVDALILRDAPPPPDCWFAWAADARRAIIWLTELARMCEGY